MNNKYIFITRLYSGLFESLKNNEWNPTGIPTITNLIEKISTDNEVVWIIVCKTENETNIVEYKYKIFRFGNFTIHVIPRYKSFKNNRVNAFFNDIKTIAKIYYLTKPDRSKLYYCDRANIRVAAFLKIFTKSKVVLRLLGLYPDQKVIAQLFISKLWHPITYISYKVPYDLAICTQDGSGIEYYLKKLLNKKTPKILLINGVERINKAYRKKVDKDKIKLLFVGKLIKDKGILELIEAIKDIPIHNDNFLLNVIGKGELDYHIREKIRHYGIEKYVRLRGSISRRDVLRYYMDSDIYISLNKLGNLSNTVLEAISSGITILILKKDISNFTDVYTDKVVPNEVAIKIDRYDMIKSIQKELIYLINNVEVIDEYSKKVTNFAQIFLWLWNERIDKEINILKRI